MKPLIACAAALVATLAWTVPADAHIVYFKDGTVVRGQAMIKESSVTIKGSGAEMSFPLASVRAISFTDEPIGYEQLRADDRPPGGDVLVWTAVAANVVAVVVAVATLIR